MSATVLRVEGMSCANCVRHVTEALRSVAGVDDVDVSLEAATATVRSAGDVSLDALRAAVTGAGYTIGA